MNFFSLAFMIILAVGMFYGQAQYKKKRAEWGKTLTIVCGILIIVTAVWTNLFSVGSEQREMMERENEYMAIECQYMGNYLRTVYSGKNRCLIITDPTDEYSGEEEVKVSHNATKGILS